MPAYVIVNFDVLDEVAGAAYAVAAQQSILAYGGHHLIAGPVPEPAEGSWDSAGFAVIEFPDMVTIKTWYDSSEYRRARDIREGKARVSMLFVDGISPGGFSHQAQ
ncbi:hypothetical protein ASG56_20635 [Rhodococcus sp. Leaf7]|uniref:DUF1330 domain-containing protein n=1 Tax=unclassified Rhodococcus (in: high G+C Gram-positive bacteria) TaxID=192944 RepID=UPI000701B835|nr:MULTISPECIES: DUF1330 domain-containing protein [unclassified Rhodococcus (in: high G+C Gram-positive bacteria)]KQU01932.1 hypothetical protein ASG56_20635 [Rhodococcus sp. Leaf7]KQU38225.1 hypothetical protein ASG64_20605 [Rhodococcus sp. Leaf247]